MPGVTMKFNGPSQNDQTSSRALPRSYSINTGDPLVRVRLTTHLHTVPR